jgi:hypothetical protein
VFNEVQLLSSQGPLELLLEGDMSGLVVLKAHKVNKMLPPGYRVDHDPDVAVLRRPDGSVVAYFPIWSLNTKRLLQEAKLDLASERQANS